ncbi:RrF2 family transcriptional regulator [Candidatus Omnitrophota bacterium]
MFVSQKSQYALRAIFELSKHFGEGPVKVGSIANVQAIPPRFLEVILNQLKQDGIVTSRRGNEGGYSLANSPKTLTVGDILRRVQGSLDPVNCVADIAENTCPLYGDCVFLPMWKDVKEAVLNVYDNTTFQLLLDREKKNAEKSAFSYSI